MRRFRLNKLVRDGIVADMHKMGQQPHYRVLSDTEYLESLQAKLLEEASEIDLMTPKALSELADLKEVIDAAVKALGATPEALIDTQKQKRDKMGSFDKKLYIQTLTLKDDDPWVEYYAKEPNRFKELRP